jgi:copper homeostasis protein (lipoprotein)
MSLRDSDWALPGILRCLHRPRCRGLFLPGLLVILGLGGCVSTSEEGSGERAHEPVTRYVGILPCSDCREIRADLTLHRDAEDGRPVGYYLQQTHVDAVGGDYTSTFWGEWRLRPVGEALHYRLEGLERPVILRLEEEGERLGWVGIREFEGLEAAAYELWRAEPLR